MTIPVFNIGVSFTIVFITTVFHTLGQIHLALSLIGPPHFKKVEKGRIIEICGPAETIFGPKRGPAMAGPPTTALSFTFQVEKLPLLTFSLHAQIYGRQMVLSDAVEQIVNKAVRVLLYLHVL